MNYYQVEDTEHGTDFSQDFFLQTTDDNTFYYYDAVAAKMIKVKWALLIDISIHFKRALYEIDFMLGLSCEGIESGDV
jgi:hypothetical protein